MRRAHSQKGLTLMELMVALLIGSILLTAAMLFMNSTSKTIKLGHENSVNTSVAQQALSRMVKELKGVNVDAPPLYAVSPTWDTLPALPYSSLEIYPYPNTSGSVAVPAAPAARKFASQASPSDIYHKWYPNPADGKEDNSLVFYRAPAPGPGGTSQVVRISYRLDAKGRLLREVQKPLSSGSLSFQSSPTPEITVIADAVDTLQFTYPEFERQMSASLDNDLTTLQTNEGYQALQVSLNENFRKIIRIRLVMKGARSGNGNFPGVELTTEVRLRSE